MAAVAESRASFILPMAAVLLAGSLCARAAPPEDADPYTPTARWFRSLYDADGNSCCSRADCRPTDYRVTAQGWEALIDRRFGVPEATWMPVPESKILKRTPNPIHRLVICYTRDRGILCAVLPDEG